MLLHTFVRRFLARGDHDLLFCSGKDLVGVGRLSWTFALYIWFFIPSPRKLMEQGVEISGVAEEDGQSENELDLNRQRG